MIPAILTTLFLPAILFCIYKPPSRLIRYLAQRWPDVLFRVPTTKKIVALTIDDAPSLYTPEILRVLQEHQAAATFFVIGSQIPNQESILPDLVRAGCELGNHAMYDEPSFLLGQDALADQIREVQLQIAEAYENADVRQNTWFFRPGGGVFTGRMRSLLHQLGYRLVLGDVYPHDPKIPFWRLNARHVLSMVKPGSIIVCHDRRGWTVPMLQRVLPELRQRGYRVVTVSELLQESEGS